MSACGTLVQDYVVTAGKSDLPSTIVDPIEEAFPPENSEPIVIRHETEDGLTTSFDETRIAVAIQPSGNFIYRVRFRWTLPSAPASGGKWNRLVRNKDGTVTISSDYSSFRGDVTIPVDFDPLYPAGKGFTPLPRTVELSLFSSTLSQLDQLGRLATSH
ncbi:MAG: hypothetical protein AAFR07_02355 [Pseudomonadota bacterium]